MVMDRQLVSSVTYGGKPLEYERRDQQRCETCGMKVAYICSHCTDKNGKPIYMQRLDFQPTPLQYIVAQTLAWYETSLETDHDTWRA